MQKEFSSQIPNAKPRNRSQTAVKTAPEELLTRTATEGNGHQKKSSFTPFQQTPDGRVRLWNAFDTNVECLKHLIVSDVWEFDIFAFGETSEGRPLQVMMGYLYHVLHFDALNINFNTYLKFIEAVELGYNNVPYHNSYHATDVVQSIRYMYSQSELSGILQPNDIFLLVITAAVHDLGHRGRSNNFEIASQSGLAIRYNDISVLENHHAALASRFMQNPEFDIISEFSPKQKREFRELLIQTILATDLKHHFAQTANLKQTLDKDPPDRDVVIMNCVHAADISSPCRPPKIALEWTRRLEQEWFAEGDDQKRLKLEVGPMNDRDKPATAISQSNFLKFLVQPLMETLSQVIGEEAFEVILKYLKENQEFFQNLAQEQAVAVAAAAAAATPLPTPIPSPAEFGPSFPEYALELKTGDTMVIPRKNKH
eukprot:TRINITY_DN8764_c0_g1_i3.p1 TRINITY_DN8764_c0_g1~~TRINITY_DN8764_c0_g1_i3.p1  ORF type:complete len:427 (+),score=83.00 TRINITY_DN8764_c0_g1_i3:90-1370(+)